MSKSLFLLMLILICVKGVGQELFVFSEPASSMPAKSVRLKLSDHIVTYDKRYDRGSNRIMPQVMFGINKNLMMHIGSTFSNMHTNNFQYESVSLYAKYRLLSKDDVHTHFRMAVFADASKTQAPFHYDEITLMGDKGGVEAGVIATQLWNKLAVSGTVSHIQVLDKSRSDKTTIYVPSRNYQAMNYSFSTGFLLFPKKYTDYQQTNFNIYAEVLAQQTLDQQKHYVDLAPGLQVIFNSNFKINVGHRFQLSGNMDRMATNSWQVSIERTFLNALSRK